MGESSVIEELREIETKSGQAKTRDDLKALFAQADEIARKHSSDFDVQVAVAELKQKLVSRAVALPVEMIPLIEPVAETIPEAFPDAPPEVPVDDPRPTAAIPLWPFAVLAVLAAGIGGQRYLESRKPTVLTVNVSPATATVTINGEGRCAGTCDLKLAAGSYQVSAVADGFLPAQPVLITLKGKPSVVTLNLKPVDPAIRILTDLDQAKVSIDNGPASEIADGQILLEHLSPGLHALRVFGRNGEALMSVETAEGKAPVLTAPVVTRDLFALTVASFAGSAHVATSVAGTVLKRNGEPAEADWKDFAPGVYEIAAGDRTVKEKFNAAPTLTAFLKSDVNAGTLIVVSNEDDAKVFVNGDEYKRKLQKGQLRIQTLGQVRVSVGKDGFQVVEPQTVQVKKGQEVRVEFALKEIPKAQPKPIETAKAAPAPTPLPEPEPPKPAPVIERKQEPAPKQAPTSAPAPRNGSIADFADAWKADDGGWSRKGGGFVKFNPTPDGTFTFSVKLIKGGSLFRGGRVRWFLNYVDDKNYSLYETDGKTFWANVYMKGVKYERTKVPVNISDKAKTYTIQIEVTPEHTLTRVKNGDNWINLDGWIEPGRDFTQGKFGFLVQGNDEIALSDFQFVPR